MLRQILVCICWSSVFAIIVPLAAQPTSSPVDSGVVSEGSVECGLRLSVQISDARISPGKKFKVKLVLKNVGLDEIPIGFSDLFADYDIDLKTNGEAVPLTRYGRQQKSIAPMSSSVLGILKPGDQADQQVDLTRIFDLSLEAKYELQFTRKLDNGKGVSSGVLKFEIVGTATTTQPAHDEAEREGSTQ
jgi:hypothetical protein